MRKRSGKKIVDRHHVKAEAVGDPLFEKRSGSVAEIRDHPEPVHRKFPDIHQPGKIFHIISGNRFRRGQDGPRPVPAGGTEDSSVINVQHLLRLKRRKAGSAAGERDNRIPASLMMPRSDQHSPVQSQFFHGKVEYGCRADPEINHIASRRKQSGETGGFEHWRRGARINRHADRSSVEPGPERGGVFDRKLSGQGRADRSAHPGRPQSQESHFSAVSCFDCIGGNIQEIGGLRK